MTDGFGFDGKVVLVTGAARGIGAAISRVFAAAGARVIATDVLEAELAATVQSIGPGAEPRHLDVTDESAWASSVGDVVAKHGRLDVLVNNAGILAFGDLQSTTAAQLRRLFEVNVVGVFLGMKAVFPVMKAAGRGAIVNMSSSSGLMGNNAVGAYGATKWAVRGLTRSAALEYGPHGVRVNSVHPYGIDTYMSNPQGAPRETLNAGYRNVPLQRMGDPGEVANAVLYLASDAASYTSGAELAIDGATCAGQYFYGLPGAPY
jgi:3alpha(or 20beta)-hydroxysteroid dehydrogenase